LASYFKLPTSHLSRLCAAATTIVIVERYSLVSSLDRSQILRDLRAMQAQAAEFSADAGEFRCFLERRVQKQFVLIHLF
jgi:ABC-type bacteriocin/lantibiotic exporter with double-glycine peptidase domain